MHETQAWLEADLQQLHSNWPQPIEVQGRMPKDSLNIQLALKADRTKRWACRRLLIYAMDVGVLCLLQHAMRPMPEFGHSPH